MLLFIGVVVLFYRVDDLKKRIGIEKPDSEIGKKIDDAMGISRIHQVDRAKSIGVKSEFRNLKTAFMMYYTTYGEYPESLDELIDKNLIGPGIKEDFWRQGYRTEFKGSDLIITSPGPDRIKNTADDITERIPLTGAGPPGAAPTPR